MASGSVSWGRYIIGVTYSRPLLRPRWCTRTIGAPAKFPPTRPSFSRNSAIVFAFQSSGSLMSTSCLLGPKDDLAVGVAAFQLGVGLADLREGVDVGDRHLELPVGDQARQVGQHPGARPRRRSPVGLHPVLPGGGEVGDRVDPVGRDAEGEGEFDVPAAERI